MLKLNLDWMTEAAPAPEGDQGDGVRVELVKEVGENGWPEIVVWAPDGPTLWAWLQAEYASDDEDASELAGMADWV